VSSPDSTQGLANMQMVPTCYRATEPWRCMVGYRLFWINYISVLSHLKTKTCFVLANLWKHLQCSKLF